jgi:hypothetical protein
MTVPRDRTACVPSASLQYGLLCPGKPHTGRSLASKSVTVSSPLKASGSVTPPAAGCGFCVKGSASNRACSTASACNSALATAFMMVSRPTAISATDVALGGMLTWVWGGMEGKCGGGVLTRVWEVLKGDE